MDKQIRVVPGELTFRFVNVPNMNATQRRTMRRWEKRHLPQMLKRYQEYVEREASALIAAAKENKT